MYNHKEIESKWQKYWEENKTFKINNDFTKPKYYCLDMFPYPSGAGLHVGHPEGMTANDIVARYKHAKGYNVLHPMGWDAFGLPAENYAIKTGTHPRITTDKNIDTFRKQIKALGFSYDWDREIDTTDPKYYKWTQWIFLKLFEKGLAYEQDLPINYCPSCKTGLANEEVLNDFTCERCGTKVEKKKIRQWVLGITKYAERLLADVDKLDWPESIKEMQRNWIGKSEGCEFEMKKVGEETKSIRVYTTRIDTVFGMTYAVLAPDHKDVMDFITPEQKIACLQYIEDSAKKSDQDRTQDDKEKTGVFTGSYLINPFNGKEVPLWIADYVLGNYGTGAVMAVPAHDERDFEFAKKYDLEIRQSIAKESLPEKEFLPINDVEILKRVTVDIIIENDKGEILLISEKSTGNEQFYFPGGGLEKGESEIEAVKRELLEETGYKNFEIIGQVKNSYRHLFAYRHIKNKNQDMIGCAYYVKLLSEIRQDSEVEDGKHRINWIKKDNVDNVLNWKDHKESYWDMFVNLKAITDYGVLVNSGEFNGLTSEEAKIKLTQYAEKNNFGTKKVNYKLRDWLFSRQRYWGEPIPLIHLPFEQLKNLPHISEEDYDKMQNEIESLINKKMRVAPLQAESGTPMGTTALLSHTDIILKNTTKVKEKRKKSFKLKEVFEKKYNETKEIRISGRYLISHFQEKTGFEKVKRLRFSYSIISNLEKVNFISETFGLLNISGQYWVVILEKNSDGSFDLITYYNFKSLNKLLKKAYILKKEPRNGESSCDSTTCSGKVRELIVGGKVFSKIYDGLYGKIICDYNLPLELPEVEDFAPAGDGNSPLAKVDDFVNVKLADNLTGKRETNTMPQWGGSCWYYLKYMDPDNSEMLVNPEVEKYWGQVDSYVGGAEHAVLHLLYARFWHKFLFDIGVVSSDEPFYRLRNQGLILAHAYQRKNGGLLANDLVEEKAGKYFEIETGEEVDRIVSKMSKSLKNVVNPDDIVEEYGADSLRLYEMVIADFKDAAPWDSKGIIGVRRFIEKSERLFTFEAKLSTEDDTFTMKLLHKTIKKVEEDIENYKFNTAIAQMMILVNNGLPKDAKLQSEWKEKFVIILHPFAPHLAEELYSRLRLVSPSVEKDNETSLDGNDSIFFATWPEYDPDMVIDDTVKIGIQVLGKLRGDIEVGVDEDKDSVLTKAKAEPNVAKWIEGKEIVKEIYVPGKIVNLVVR